MLDCIRVSESFEHASGDQPCKIWAAIERIVEKRRGIKPFDQIKNIDTPLFQYLPSTRSIERRDILSQHQKFRATVEVEGDVETHTPPIGPVEDDVVRFARSCQPHLGVLVGGMGCGKSTTLKYLSSAHLSDIEIRYCDLDSTIPSNSDPSDAAAKLLAQYLAVKINDLIPPEDEFTKMWTWGMSFADTDAHSAKYVLADSQSALRRELGAGWLGESEEGIRIRKECHKEIQADPGRYLTYLALAIDYYLTVVCADKRGSVLILLDNVDPLPPRLQYELLRCASRVQEAARCKLLVALRPLTYSKNLQAANRTVDVIGHIGPTAFDLIEARVQRLIIETDMPSLQLRITDDAGSERVVGQGEIKLWIKEVVDSIRHQTTTMGPEVSARKFLEGICNNSLRNALVVAPKLFGSPVIPFSMPMAATTARGTASTRIKSHDLIRAMLIGWHSHFENKQGRVTDNIFDLGRGASCASLTCKVRILKKLASAANGIVALEELRDHLATFGYRDATVLDGINAVIMQTKRLAWSDLVVQYESFSDAPTSKLEITDGGRFYVAHAILNLEYVQEVHLDVPLPRHAILGQYHNNRFSDRIRSLYLFMRHLQDEDRREVLNVLARQGGVEYTAVYGKALFSSQMAEALGRQVMKVGRAMATKAGERFQHEIEEGLIPWGQIEQLTAREEGEILRKLSTVA